MYRVIHTKTLMLHVRIYIVPQSHGEVFCALLPVAFAAFCFYESSKFNTWLSKFSYQILIFHIQARQGVQCTVYLFLPWKITEDTIQRCGSFKHVAQKPTAIRQNWDSLRVSNRAVKWTKCRALSAEHPAKVKFNEDTKTVKKIISL